MYVRLMTKTSAAEKNRNILNYVHEIIFGIVLFVQIFLRCCRCNENIHFVNSQMLENNICE